MWRAAGHMGVPQAVVGPVASQNNLMQPFVLQLAYDMQHDQCFELQQRLQHMLQGIGGHGVNIRLRVPSVPAAILSQLQRALTPRQRPQPRQWCLRFRHGGERQ